MRTCIEEGRRSSRHDQVPGETWRRARTVLPGARDLAGTFAAGSGPNCFGTVMAAAGVDGAGSEWMQREPFEQWLAGNTRPGGSDDQPGTVLVWRSPDHLVQHAAVAIGEGWVLHKPSQGWMSPIKILAAAEAKRSARPRPATAPLRPGSVRLNRPRPKALRLHRERMGWRAVSGGLRSSA